MGTMVTPKTDRNGTYYIRKVVPKELQYIVGKTALKRSLKTKVLKDANLLAPPIILEFNSTIESARLKHDAEAELSEGVISSFVETWLHDTLVSSRSDWSQHLTLHDETYVAETYQLESALQKAETNDDFVHELVTLVKNELDTIKLNNQLLIDNHSQYWSVFVRNVAKAKIELIQRAFKHYQSQVMVPKVKEALFQLPEVPDYLTEDTKASTPQVTVKDLYERYCEALRRREPKAAEQRISSYRTAHQKAVEHFSDRPINKLQKKDFVDFRNVLEQLPKQTPKIKKLSLSEQVETAKKQNLERISIKTVRIQLTAVSALFEFAVNEALIDSNPVHGVGKDISRQTNITGNHYTDEEIQKFFSSEIYTSALKPIKADYGQAHYWIPLILYYTGARVEEIAQLYVADVHLNHEVPHFKLTSERDDQSIKTGDTRLIPIHEHLLELGFAEYVSGLATSGRLFPKLKLDSQGKYSYMVASWLSRFVKNDLGINRTQLKPMHGFRHTFITKCRELGIREDIQNAITGHRQQSMGAQYGAIQLEMMKSAIHQLPRCC